MQEEAFNRRECRPFFAGLLPEEIQRKLIAQSFGVSERNDFSLLDKIGGECAGAVSLMPPGQRPDASRCTSQPLTREELALKLAELPKRPLLAGDRGLRLSLAGAQSKMAVILTDGQYGIPLMNLSTALRRMKSVVDRVTESLGKESERLPEQQTVTHCIKANCTRLRIALG